MSPTAEDVGFCGLGSGLRGLPGLRQEDVDRQVRAQSARALALHEHAERERDGRT